MAGSVPKPLIKGVGKVAQCFDRQSNILLFRHGADGEGIRLVRKTLLIESDEIHLLIGMRINQAHHVPGLPLELEVRPTVARRIARALEDKFLKDVYLKFM